MIIISGVRLAGKTDAVPRLGHVATRFFHLYYVPLIPLGTVWLAVGSKEDDEGLPLPLSGKSIVVGWLRTVGWLALGGSAVLLGLGLMENRAWQAGLGTAGALIAAGLLIAFYKLQYFAQASYERAVELGRQLRLPREQMLLLEVAYGRLTADQAERELVKHYEVLQTTGR